MCPDIHCFGVKTKDRCKALFYTGHRLAMSRDEKLVVDQPFRQMAVVDDILNNDLADFFGLFGASCWNFEDRFDKITLFLVQVGFGWMWLTSSISFCIIFITCCFTLGMRERGNSRARPSEMFHRRRTRTRSGTRRRRSSVDRSLSIDVDKDLQMNIDSISDRKLFPSFMWNTIMT